MKEQMPAEWNEEEKRTVREHYLGDLTNEDLYKEIDRRGIVVHLTLEKASDLELAKEMESRDGLFGRLTDQALKKATDKDLADALRRRGYTVTATKTVEI